MNDAGWAPSSFVSSRSQRVSKASTARPEDYMDVEDYAEVMAGGKALVTRKEFEGAVAVASNAPASAASIVSTAVSAQATLSALIAPARVRTLTPTLSSSSSS
jgi:hypothetical protein